jgi:predicted dienelactone hydrolase
MNRSQYFGLVILSVAIAIPIGVTSIAGNYRWQLLPVLCSTIGVLLSSLVLLHLKRSVPLLLTFLTGLGVVGFLTSATLAYLYPVFTFPVPTGKYAVGTTSIDLVDNSRIELCDLTTKSHRELVIQVWYPAIATNAAKAPYLKDARLIPTGLFSHLNLIKTHAVTDAPAATTGAPYPIVIYSPGWSGVRTDNTFQTEELASHGYIVIGLEHPCAVPMAIYPNGRIIYSNLSADYLSSDAAMAEFLREGEEQLVLRTQDISFVIDRLPQIDRSQLFRGTLDLHKVGVFGHSFGGAAAAQACSIDPRLTAGMNMDGLLFGSVAQQGATQPFLFMNSDYPRPTPADLHSPDGSLRRSKQTDAWGYQQRDRWFQAHGGYNLTLLNSAHLNFSDYPLRKRYDNGGGKIPSDRAMKIINEYTVAFFDRELKGNRSSRLLDRQSGSLFPEVVFENHPQP